MLDAANGLLQLTVNNDTGSDNQHRIKNIFIGGIVNRRENVSKPGNGFGLAAARRMFNKVIAGGVVLDNIVHNPLNSTKLMETWENEHLGLFDFAGISILALFLFDIDETLDEEQDFILRPDVLPHIGDVHAVLIVGISLAEVFTNVERIEEGIGALQFRGEIHFIQVHGKRSKYANPALEKAGGRIALILVLLNGVLVALTGGVAFQFNCEDSQAIQKNNEVNAFVSLVIYLFHYGEDIFSVVRNSLGVDGAVRLAIHQPKGNTIIELYAVLDNIDQATAFLVDFRVDVINDRIVGAVFIHTAQTLHFIVLRILQKLKQDFGIHCQPRLIGCVGTDTEFVILFQTLQNQLLEIFFFSQLVCSDRHITEPPLLVFCL